MNKNYTINKTTVIARAIARSNPELNEQKNQVRKRCQKSLDCFAPLAMTVRCSVIAGLTRNLLKIAFLFFTFHISHFTLFAQNIGTCKFIITPTPDSDFAYNTGILEVNNQYYLLSGISNYPVYTQRKCIVTVFDENLNQINQIELDGGDVDFSATDYLWGASFFFYEKNSFYLLGGGADSATHGDRKFFLAKYNKDFTLAQPVSIYNMPDTMLFYRDTIINWQGDTMILADSSNEWCLYSTFMTSNKEFIIQYELSGFGLGRLLHIDTNGKILHEMYVSPFGGRAAGGPMVETDKYYIANNGSISTDILLYPKDSLEKYEWASLEQSGWFSYGTAVSVGNQLIRDHDFIDKKCNYESYRSHPIIVFYDENFKIKKELLIGDTCFSHRNGGMDYINPDSIYCAFSSANKDFGSTISIACFSSEGVLHFDHVLDIPSQDTNSFDVFYIYRVKALSNGGVLVTGRAVKYDDNYPYNNRSYLLYYHPTKNTNIVETPLMASLRRVFPNPARSHFTVTNTTNANLYLYNMVGQEVWRAYSTDVETHCNASLPQGMYVLKVEKDGVLSTHKIVVSY